jgi:hypothetical protein
MVRIAIAANPRKTFVSTIQRLQDLEACGRPFLGRERTVKVVVGVDAWAIVHRGAPRSESTVRIASIRPWFPPAPSPGWLDSDEHLLTLRASTFGAAGLG